MNMHSHYFIVTNCTFLHLSYWYCIPYKWPKHYYCSGWTCRMTIPSLNKYRTCLLSEKHVWNQWIHLQPDSADLPIVNSSLHSHETSLSVILTLNPHSHYFPVMGCMCYLASITRVLFTSDSIACRMSIHDDHSMHRTWSPPTCADCVVWWLEQQVDKPLQCRAHC